MTKKLGAAGRFARDATFSWMRSPAFLEAPQKKVHPRTLSKQGRIDGNANLGTDNDHTLIQR